MPLLILLDAGPLGLVIHPKGGDDAKQCKAWFQDILAGGAIAVVPAISDYEVRRELSRAGKLESCDRLDLLVEDLGYLSINKEMMVEAARHWSRARKGGWATAPDSSLDADCILAAQAMVAPTVVEFTREQRIEGIRVIIATTNPKHLSRYTAAEHWSAIRPDSP